MDDTSRKDHEELKESNETGRKVKREKYHQPSTSGSSHDSPQSPSALSSQGKLGELSHTSSSIETDSAFADGMSTDSSHTSALSPRSLGEAYSPRGPLLSRTISSGASLNNSECFAPIRSQSTSPRASSHSAIQRRKNYKRLQVSPALGDSLESLPTVTHSLTKKHSKPHESRDEDDKQRADDAKRNGAFSNLNYDERASWVSRVQYENPTIYDVRQRVRPMARTLSFSRTFHVKTEFPKEDILTGAVPPIKRSMNEIVLGLVLQHLQKSGLTKTVAAIHQELDRMSTRGGSSLDETLDPDTPSQTRDDEVSNGHAPHKKSRRKQKTIADFQRELTLPGNTSARDFISTSFDKDQAFFEREWRESPLLTVLRSSVRRAQDVYDLAIADRGTTASLSESSLEEKLYALGMLDEEEDVADDVDIWEEGPDPEEDLNAPRTATVRPVSGRHTRTDSKSGQYPAGWGVHPSPNTGYDRTQQGGTPPTIRPSASPAPHTSSNSNGSTGSTQAGGGDYSSYGKSSNSSSLDRSSTPTPTASAATTTTTTAERVPISKNTSSGSIADSHSATNPDAGHPSNTSVQPSSSGDIATSMRSSPLSAAGGSDTMHHSRLSSSRGQMANYADSELKGRKLIYDMYVEVEDDDERPIRAATLNKLVEVATSSKLSDLNFLPTFLLTYKSFTTPKRLFEKLRQRFNVPPSLAEKQGIGPEQWRDMIAMPIRLRVISFLKRWIQDYPEDIDKTLLGEMKKFVDKLTQTDPGLRLIANSISAYLDKLVAQWAYSNASGLSAYNSVSVIGGHGFSLQGLMHGFSPYASASALVFTQSQHIGPNQYMGPNSITKRVTVPTGTPPVPKVPKMIFHPSLSLYQIDQEEFARQLTIMDSHVFISIKPSELLNQSWNKPKLKHLAPNVLKMVNMFNQLSHAISAQILQGHRPKDRAKIIEWWIKVAEHCKHMSNYHGLMAVVSGINSGPTVRLRQSRKEVSKSLLDQLAAYEAIFESDGSFSSYRSTLHGSVPPLIPYLGIHLTDLTFIEEGNKDMHGHLINFAKRRLLYQTISGLQNFQQTGYNLQPVRQIQDIIANLKAGEVKDLFKLSLMREPRERS